MSSAPRRLTVDATGAFRPAVRDGVSRRRASELYGALGQLHATMRTDPAIPGAIATEPILALAEQIRARADGPVGVIGQAGAVHGACVAPLVLGKKVLRITAPSSTQLDSTRPWVALLGPPWVPAVVDQLVQLGAAVVVCGPPAEPGEEVAPPPGGWWFPDPLAGDGRAGALGASALLVAALAGVPLDRLAAGVQSAREACASTSYADHVAYGWSLVAALADVDLHRVVSAHLASDPRLMPLARWAARVWGSTLVQEFNGATVRARMGGRALDGMIGDEELWEMLAAGPPDLTLTTWELAPNADTLGDLARRQLDAFARHAAERGIPTLRVRLAELDAAGIGVAMGVTLHAATAAARLLERDPRTLVSLPGLYQAMDVDAPVDAE